MKKVIALFSLLIAASAFGGLISIGAGGRVEPLDVVASSDLQTDWDNRKSASGVIKYTDFNTSSAVDNWRFVNGTGFVPSPAPTDDGAKVAYVQNCGIIPGHGCMRLMDNPVSNNSTSWAWNFDPAVTSGSTTTSYIIPPGTTFYVQVRVKYNGTRFDNRPGSGMKTMDVGSAHSNNTNQVVQLAPINGHNYFSVEGATTAPAAWSYVPFSGGANFDMMPGYPSGTPATSASPGSCHYDTQPTGCLLFQANVWYTIELTIKGGTPGSADTVVKGEIAAQDATSFTTFYYRTDNDISAGSGGYQDGNGYSGLTLINRNENHGGIPTGAFIYYDQLILSSNHIAVPAPTTAPTYFTNATEGRWTTVPGTTAGTIAATGQSGSAMFAFSGMAASQGERKLYAVGMGGHADYGGDDSYVLDLSQDSTTAWTQLTASGSLSGGTNGYNAVGDYGDGSKRADHTYNIEIATAPGTVYFPAMGAMDSSLGYPSTQVWKWQASQIANGKHGYTALGKAFASDPLQGGSLATVYSGSCSAYDPAARKVWYTNLYGWSTNPDAIWSVSTDDDSITTYDGHGAFAEFGVWCTFIPEYNSFVVGTSAGTIYRMDVGTHAWTSVTVSGSPPTDYTVGRAMHYYQAGHQLVSWPLSGTSINVADLPYAPTGTWVFRTKTAVAGGVTPVGPFSTPHNRLNIMQDMGDGAGAIVYVADRDQRVDFWRLPKGAIP